MKRILLLPVLTLLACAPLVAAEKDDAETKLRELLKSTMLQLREAQNQVATAQAAQVAGEVQIADLSSKLATLTKQSGEEKLRADKSIAELKARVADQDSKLGQYIEALSKWKKAANEASALAQNKEAARAKLEADAILLQRRVDDQKMRNEGMYKLGTEILTRYKKFALGESLAAREPFVGLSRVKLENLFQGYQDKLVEQTIKTP